MKIPVYRPEEPLRRYMKRTRTGIFLLAMGFAKENKHKFMQNMTVSRHIKSVERGIKIIGVKVGFYRN